MSTAEDDRAEEAERRISEAARNQARTLDLSLLGLTAVPDAIGQLTGLTRLILTGNRLTALPASIGQLTSLRVLVIEGNPDLPSPPPEVIARGAQAVLAFLQARTS